MSITDTLGHLPHPPASWLFQPVRALPWELRNKPVELALNRAFSQALQEGDFELLEGRWLHIRVTDLQLDFYLTAEGEALRLNRPRPCDVVIQGESQDFLALAARREDPDTLFFHRRLIIEGDTELGLGLKNLLDSLELEQLPAALRWAIARADSLAQAWTAPSLNQR